MSESGSEPLFPNWTRDATAASLRERREVLEGRLGRLAEPLRESTSPRFAELHAVRDSLAAMPEGRAWRERAQALTVAQEQRQHHVASTRRGRRLALALAAGVLALSAAGWVAKQPRALVPTSRTHLRGQRIHTAGVGVGVAGHGVVTLGEAPEVTLRIHQGTVEVSSQGGEHVLVEAGPHTVALHGGRMEVARLGGETTVRAAEGQVTLLDEEGEAVVLAPGGPARTAPSPESGETCSAGVAEDRGATTAGGSGVLLKPQARALQVTTAGSKGQGASLGGTGPEQTASPAVGEPPRGASAQAVATAPRFRGPPTLSLDVDYRPWSPHNRVRTSGGARGRIAPSPETPPLDAGSQTGAQEAAPSLLASAVHGAAVLPDLGVAHEVRHTVDGSTVPLHVDPLSGVGFCPLPDPTPALSPVPEAVGPAPMETKPGGRNRVATKPESAGRAGVAAAPTREIPALPAPQDAPPSTPAREKTPAVRGSGEPPQDAQEALLGVVFGLGIDGAECAP